MSTEMETETEWDFDFTTDYEAWHWYKPEPHGEHLLIYCGHPNIKQCLRFRLHGESDM